MNVASANTKPSSVTSWSPILSFRDIFVFWGEYWTSTLVVLQGGMRGGGGVSYLIDVRLRPGGSGHDVLHEARNLSHDVYPVQPLLEATLYGSLHGLAILGCPSPGVLDGRRLGPVVLGVALAFEMGGTAVAAAHDDLAILGNDTHIHDSRAVRSGRGELHEDGRVRRPLEVAEIPLGGGVVGLHALQRMGEEGLASEVDGAVLGCDRSLGSAPRPEEVAHRTPGVLEIGAEQCLAGLARLEAWRHPLDGQVDDGLLVVHRLDSVCGPILGKLDGAIIGIEVRLVFAEVVVVQGCRGPEVGCRAVEAEDLAVELAGRPDAAAKRSVRELQSR